MCLFCERHLSRVGPRRVAQVARELPRDSGDTVEAVTAVSCLATANEAAAS